PDVELGPVRQREDARVLALVDARVVEGPQLGTLVFGVPLAEVVAEAEDPLFGARALLVAARAADRRVKAPRGERVEQRRRLQTVARRARTALLDNPALIDRVLDASHDQTLTKLTAATITKLDRLRK